MEPADAGAYSGRVLRETAKAARWGRARALKTYFLVLVTEAERHAIAGSLEPKDPATLPDTNGPLGSR